MLYLFGFPGGFWKLGYTSKLRERQARGFWHNAHPPELCGRLGEPKLLGYWEGTWELEQALHSLFRAERGGRGEFYDGEPPLDFLRNVLEPLEAPPEIPGVPPEAALPPRLSACCGGKNFGFQRLDHAHRAYATKDKKAPCARCGSVVSVRHDKLKIHQQTQRCAMRAEAAVAGVPGGE